MKKIKMVHFQITRWIIVKILLTVGLAAFCLGVWPGYLFRTYQTIPSNGGAQLTSWLSAHDVIQQQFSPSYSWLSRIKAAVAFDENMFTDEYLIFELWDESGKCLCSREIYFNQIDDSIYFDISVNKRLKPGRQYVWTLTLSEPAELQYALLISDNADNNSGDNDTLFINGEDTHKNALSPYEYYAHYDKAQIIGGFWIGAILVWLLLLEVADRAESLSKRKKQ